MKPTKALIVAEGNLMDFDTVAFNRLAAKGVEVRVRGTRGLPWVEIDFEADYQRARRLAAKMP